MSNELNQLVLLDVINEQTTHAASAHREGRAVNLTEPENKPRYIGIAAQVTKVLVTTNAQLYSASIKLDY